MPHTVCFSTTWKSPKRDDDKKRKKRPYTLEISKPQKTEEQPSEKLKLKTKVPGELLKAGEKQKRSKSRTRSPMQTHRKAQQAKKSPPTLLRSPAFSEDMPEDDRKEKGATSDESSGQPVGEQASPRKAKKVNHGARRKSLSKSPRRRSGSNEDKPSSLPNTLPRRRSVQQTRDGDDTPSTHSSKSRLRYVSVFFL